MQDDGEPGTVAILMGTYNGAPYLHEQLASLEAQSYPKIGLLVSDDGSSDATLEVLDNWRERWPKGSFSVVEGPGRGFAENFRALIVNAPTGAGYYAFCDQDDVWESSKLDKAVAWLRAGSPAEPRLFCSRTRTMTEAGDPAGYSPLFAKEPSFRNALVQSIAGGNTMVLNRAAFEIVRQASRRSSFVSHDWWCYLLVTGAGGMAHYSAEPLVRYRQHATNQVGANATLTARFARVRRLFRGQFWEWTNANIAGLEANADLLTEDARRALRTLKSARQGRLIGRLRALWTSGLYRQTRLGHLGLYLAVAINRL